MVVPWKAGGVLLHKVAIREANGAASSLPVLLLVPSTSSTRPRRTCGTTSASSSASAPASGRWSWENVTSRGEIPVCPKARSGS